MNTSTTNNDTASTASGGYEVIQGTADNDSIEVFTRDHIIKAGSGDDYVLAPEGHNFISGGDGNDTLMGRGVIEGGAGNDILSAVGDAQYNVYYYKIGDGQDSLFAYGIGNPARPQGNVAFGADLDTSRLWFRRRNEDLVVNVVGSGDGMTIKNWYQDDRNQVAGFLSGDRKLLTNAKVDALVEAMAGFAAPVSGSSQLDETVSQALAPALAASWV